MKDCGMSKKRVLPGWMKNAADRVKERCHDTATGASACQASLDLPLLKFEGQIISCYHRSHCGAVCSDITESFPRGIAMGFDMEWPVTFKRGVNSKTATIQICTGPDKCFIFHLTAMSGLPNSLWDLVADKRMKKVGVNIESDMWKLARDFDGFPARDVIRDSVLDLSQSANEILNSAERWSLDGLAQNLLGMRLDKSAELRQGRWDDYPLSAEQLQYAATDAYASLRVYEVLTRRSRVD